MDGTTLLLEHEINLGSFDGVQDDAAYQLTKVSPDMGMPFMWLLVEGAYNVVCYKYTPYGVSFSHYVTEYKGVNLVDLFTEQLAMDAIKQIKEKIG